MNSSGKLGMRRTGGRFCWRIEACAHRDPIAVEKEVHCKGYGRQSNAVEVAREAVKVLR